MKLQKEEKDALIADMLELLDPAATKEVPTTITVTGYYLRTQHHVYKDKNGNPINDILPYKVPSKRTVAINHRSDIGRIIADAKDREEMETNLAAHLSAYSKDRPKRTN